MCKLGTNMHQGHGVQVQRVYLTTREVPFFVACGGLVFGWLTMPRSGSRGPVETWLPALQWQSTPEPVWRQKSRISLHAILTLDCTPPNAPSSFGSPALFLIQPPTFFSFSSLITVFLHSSRSFFLSLPVTFCYFPICSFNMPSSPSPADVTAMIALFYTWV